MLSIGELAHRTGVSRRMLRHWEAIGLLAPAEIDAWNGYRRYAPRQTGRVRAIAALRVAGFGLDAIGDLLSSGLSAKRLVELLRSREAELDAQISEAAACLKEVHLRLRSIEEGHDVIVQNLKLGSLPELKLAGLREVVEDEAEISDVVSGLLAQLRERLPRGKHNVVLTYDGTTDPDAINVTAAVVIPNADARLHDLESITIRGSERGATVRYAEPPSDIGDSWITLDAALAEHSLATTGVYRQTLEADGGVVLQAPVVELAE